MKYFAIFGILFCMTSLAVPAQENPSGDGKPDREPVTYGTFVDETRSWATLGRLYVVIATDDNHSDLGTIAQKNGDLLMKTLKSHLAEGSAVLLKIPAENLSREMIFLMISNLPLQENDALFFYFSGHGGVDRKTGQYFHLSPSGEDIFRSELQAAFDKRKHRLSVLVSDACDSTSASDSKERQTAKTDKQDEKTSTPQPGAEGSTTSPLFFSLFFMGHGQVDLASSSVGQASLVSGNGMGCFTETLAGLLQSNHRKKLSWTYLFPYLRDGTSSLFTQTYPEGTTTSNGIRQIDQVPVALALGRKKVASPMFEKFYPQGFDSEENMPNSSRNVTEEDRNIVTTLIRGAVDEIRPYNERDDDTHENVEILDTDNLVLGANGEPFSKKPEPVNLEASDSTMENVGNNVSEPSTSHDEQEQKIRLGVQAADNRGDGVRITNLISGFPGKNAGLEVGDIILEINGKKITSEQEFSDAVDKADGKLEMLIRDGKNNRVVPLTIGLK